MIAVSTPPAVQADMARAETINWSPEDVHELDAIIERLMAYYVEQMDARDVLARLEGAAGNPASGQDQGDR